MVTIVVMISLLALLIAPWTALVAYHAYRMGLQAGYRQTMSLPPAAGVFAPDPWKILRAADPNHAEEESPEPDPSDDDAPRKAHNNFG